MGLKLVPDDPSAGPSPAADDPSADSTVLAADDPAVAAVEEALSGVIDPELGLDIVAMGLIYGIARRPDGGLTVDMTLTTPGCPVSSMLPQEAQERLDGALGAGAATVVVVWDPPWTPERLRADAAAALGL